MKPLLLLSELLMALSAVSDDSSRHYLGVQAYTGFIIPHAPDLKAISQSRPVGTELTYSRLSLSRAAYERCHCFARIGTYINYVAFNNPDELGRTVGLGGYFEPLIGYRQRLYYSLRATAGLSYISRVYNAESNPRNTFFSSPVSGLLALSATAHYRLAEQIQISATASYNHISNGGIRQPNRGMNFPTLGIGLLYVPESLQFPDPGQWVQSPLARRFTKRVMAFGSVRTLPESLNFPESAGWVWGIMATAGYRVNRFHAFTGGVEFTDDGYIREQLRRENKLTNPRQLGLLGGYELWLGRYTFTTHLGWNIVQPTPLTDGPIFQRYQLLYTVNNRYLAGVGLKARLNVAEGFELRTGIRF